MAPSFQRPDQNCAALTLRSGPRARGKQPAAALPNAVTDHDAPYGRPQTWTGAP